MATHRPVPHVAVIEALLLWALSKPVLAQGCASPATLSHRTVSDICMIIS